MWIKIIENAHFNHAYPDWPWYLGTYVNNRYEPKYEGKVFQVEDADREGCYQLVDKVFADKFIGNRIAYIEKSDCIIIDQK